MLKIPHFHCQGLKFGHLYGRPTLYTSLYSIITKAGLYPKAVQVSYIPITTTYYIVGRQVVWVQSPVTEMVNRIFYLIHLAPKVNSPFRLFVPIGLVAWFWVVAQTETQGQVLIVVWKPNWAVQKIGFEYRRTIWCFSEQSTHLMKFMHLIGISSVWCGNAQTSWTR